MWWFWGPAALSATNFPRMHVEGQGGFTHRQLCLSTVKVVKVSVCVVVQSSVLWGLESRDCVGLGQRGEGEQSRERV